jgi:hypothetical protein
MQSIEKQDTAVGMRDLEAERQRNGRQKVTEQPQATQVGEKGKDGVAEEKESWRGVVVLCGCMMLSRMFPASFLICFRDADSSSFLFSVTCMGYDHHVLIFPDPTVR